MKVKCFLPFQRFLELDELLVEEHEYVRSCAENSKGSSGKLFLSFGVKTLSSGSSGIIMLSCMLLLLIIKLEARRHQILAKRPPKPTVSHPCPLTLILLQCVRIFLYLMWESLVSLLRGVMRKRKWYLRISPLKLTRFVSSSIPSPTEVLIPVHNGGCVNTGFPTFGCDWPSWCWKGVFHV